MLFLRFRAGLYPGGTRFAIESPPLAALHTDAKPQAAADYLGFARVARVAACSAAADSSPVSHSPDSGQPAQFGSLSQQNSWPRKLINSQNRAPFALGTRCSRLVRSVSWSSWSRSIRPSR